MLRNFAVVAVALLAVAVFSPGPAQAVPTEPCTTIASPADAGLIPDAVTLSKQTNYEIQCKNPSCARWYIYDGGTQTAVCTAAGQGYHLPTVNLSATASTNTVSGTGYKFSTGGMNRMRVAALDGGEPRCTVCLDVSNIR